MTLIYNCGTFLVHTTSTTNMLSHCMRGAVSDKIVRCHGHCSAVTK